jgi:mannitol/fructose-specific phosphotransferase system IIA component (Ntr-type)
MTALEFLSVGEVAENFGWTPRFVERLAVLGSIPAQEVNGQWHFRREQLVEWLDRKIQTLDTSRIADLETTLEAELQAASRNIHVAERLQGSLVSLDSGASAKPAVLKELVTLAERTGLVTDGPALLSSLAEREAILSTGLPGGFAICHPRHLLPQAMRRTVITAMRTQRPIDFGADGGEKTQLFFLVAAIDDRAHLYALARLIRVVRGNTLEALFEVRSPEAFIEVIREREQRIDSGISDGH